MGGVLAGRFGSPAEQASDKGLFLTVCRPLVEEVGEILEQMLGESTGSIPQ